MKICYQIKLHMDMLTLFKRLLIKEHTLMSLDSKTLIKSYLALFMVFNILFIFPKNICFINYNFYKFV
jgi:hypothetical protein